MQRLFVEHFSHLTLCQRPIKMMGRLRWLPIRANMLVH